MPPVHGWMTSHTLAGLKWDKNTIERVVRYIKEVDQIFGHNRGSCHRVRKYQDEFQKYGGKICPFPGAELQAAKFLAGACDFHIVDDEDRVWKYLGWTIHFIQDALCPEHIFPFQERLILFLREPHLSFMIYTLLVYGHRDWPKLVQNAPAIEITSPNDLRRKLQEAADWVYELPCSYRRNDGQSIIDPRIGKKLPFRGWDMSDKDIGMVLERTSSLVKGAIGFVFADGRF